jgi:hypothetical protein
VSGAQFKPLQSRVGRKEHISRIVYSEDNDYWYCYYRAEEYRVSPGGKERPGRDADPSPPSTFPMGRTACTEPQCLYKGALYLFYYCAKKVQE